MWPWNTSCMSSTNWSDQVGSMGVRSNLIIIISIIIIFVIFIIILTKATIIIVILLININFCFPELKKKNMYNTEIYHPLHEYSQFHTPFPQKVTLCKARYICGQLLVVDLKRPHSQRPKYFSKAWNVFVWVARRGVSVNNWI